MIKYMVFHYDVKDDNRNELVYKASERQIVLAETTDHYYVQLGVSLSHGYYIPKKDENILYNIEEDHE